MEGGKRGRSRADAVNSGVQCPDASAQLGDFFTVRDDLFTVLRDFFSVCRNTGIQTGHLFVYIAGQFFQLNHVHRIGIFRAGCDPCNLTGNSQIRIPYRNRPIDCLPCIYISVYQFKLRVKFILFIFQIFLNLFRLIGWYGFSIRVNGIVCTAFVKLGL